MVNSMQRIFWNAFSSGKSDIHWLKFYRNQLPMIYFTTILHSVWQRFGPKPACLNTHTHTHTYIYNYIAISQRCMHIYIYIYRHIYNYIAVSPTLHAYIYICMQRWGYGDIIIYIYMHATLGIWRYNYSVHWVSKIHISYNRKSIRK